MKTLRSEWQNKGIIMLGPIFIIIIIAVLTSITLTYWEDIAPNFQLILKYAGYVLLVLLGIIFVIGAYHSWKDRGKSRGF